MNELKHNGNMNNNDRNNKYLGPHFFNIFENHVAVPIKSSHSTEKLKKNKLYKDFGIIKEQYLGVVFDTHHQNRKWSCIKFLIFSLDNLQWSTSISINISLMQRYFTSVHNTQQSRINLHLLPLAYWKSQIQSEKRFISI